MITVGLPDPLCLHTNSPFVHCQKNLPTTITALTHHCPLPRIKISPPEGRAFQVFHNMIPSCRPYLSQPTSCVNKNIPSRGSVGQWTLGASTPASPILTSGGVQNWSCSLQRQYLLCYFLLETLLCVSWPTRFYIVSVRQHHCICKNTFYSLTKLCDQLHG